MILCVAATVGFNVNDLRKAISVFMSKRKDIDAMHCVYDRNARAATKRICKLRNLPFTHSKDPIGDELLIVWDGVSPIARKLIKQFHDQRKMVHQIVIRSEETDAETDEE